MVDATASRCWGRAGCCWKPVLSRTRNNPISGLSTGGQASIKRNTGIFSSRFTQPPPLARAWACTFVKSCAKRIRHLFITPVLGKVTVVSTFNWHTRTERCKHSIGRAVSQPQERVYGVMKPSEAGRRRGTYREVYTVCLITPYILSSTIYRHDQQ